MRTLDVYIPIYDWTITVVTIYNEQDEQEMQNFISQNFSTMHQDTVSEILGAIKNNNCDGGVTLTGKSFRKILVVVYRWTKEEAFYNVLNHEKRHCVDNILEATHVDDKEAAAYLDGFLSEQFYKHIDQLK